MVTVLPAAQNAGSLLGDSLSEGIGEITKALVGKRHQREENQALEDMGINVKGIRDPNIKSAIIAQTLKSKADEQKQAKRMQQILELRGKFNSGMGNQLAPGLGQTMPQQDAIKNQFLQALPIMEQIKGSELTPEEADHIWEGMQAMQGQGDGQFSQQQQMGGQQEADPYELAELYAMLGEKDLSRLETEKAKTGQKLKAQGRSEAFTLAKPILEKVEPLLSDVRAKESALDYMEDALSSGKLGAASLDALAELTGIEALRSPEGARFKTASKEFFLGNLSRVGAKGLNQMMERVVMEMSPLIGRKTEANLSVLEVLKAENDVARREAELIPEIAHSYREKHGQYPEDLSSRVDKELRPYAQQRQKEALSKIEKIQAQFEPKNKQGILMYDPSGNLRRVPHANRKEALKEGYRMP